MNTPTMRKDGPMRSAEQIREMMGHFETIVGEHNCTCRKGSNEHVGCAMASGILEAQREILHWALHPGPEGDELLARTKAKAERIHKARGHVERVKAPSTFEEFLERVTGITPEHLRRIEKLASQPAVSPAAAAQPAPTDDTLPKVAPGEQVQRDFSNVPNDSRPRSPSVGVSGVQVIVGTGATEDGKQLGPVVGIRFDLPDGMVTPVYGMDPATAARFRGSLDNALGQVPSPVQTAG